MRKRYPIKERFVTSLSNVHYIAPDDPITVHLIFDMLTNLTTNPRLQGDSEHLSEYNNQQWDVITNGLLALGLSDTARIHRVQQSTGSNSERMRALLADEHNQVHRLTRTLWRTRCAYMSLPLSWSGLIEGHPILAFAEYKEEWSELTKIADDVLRTAKENKMNAQEIDLFLLKLWGQTEPLKEITCNDLAKVTRSVIEMNGLYDESDFDL